jgi:hypothetical protein
MPTRLVYYTDGSPRDIKVGNLKVKLLHTSNRRKLQYAGEKVGMALAALWYLGKEQVDNYLIHCIRNGLSDNEFQTLRMADMPAWMAQAIEGYSKKYNRV